MKYDIIRFHLDGGDSTYDDYYTKEEALSAWERLKAFVESNRYALKKSGVVKYHFRGQKPEEMEVLEV